MARSDSEQRQRILETAVRVFAEHGRAGATTRLLGAAAGVNSALLYYYFEDKDHLFAAALRFVLQGFLARLRDHRRPFRGARDRLRYLVDGVFDYYSAHPDRMHLMVIALNLYPALIGQALTAVLAEAGIVPLDVIKEGMARRELRRLPVLDVWWNILGLCLFNLQVGNVMLHVDAQRLPVSMSSLPARRARVLELLVRGLVLPGKRQTRIRSGIKS